MGKMDIDLVRNLLNLIIADASSYPLGEGSDEAEAEREALDNILFKAKKALGALRKDKRRRVNAKKE